MKYVRTGNRIVAVLELLDIDARLADVPRPERRGLLGKIGAAFADADENSTPYRRLELE